MMTELQCLLFACIISADNDEFEEPIKQEIISRRKEKPEDWEYIFEPLGENGKKIIELFKYKEIPGTN